jgi:hypothetical protein
VIAWDVICGGGGYVSASVRRPSRQGREYGHESIIQAFVSDKTGFSSLQKMNNSVIYSLLSALALPPSIMSPSQTTMSGLGRRCRLTARYDFRR